MPRYNTEQEAVEAIKNFSIENIKIGKGSSNIGKCKYSDEFKINAILLANKIGVRKAGKETKAGSTQISLWRKDPKLIKYYAK